MNLQKLFEQQKILDDRINAEHPPKEGEDRLAKKILALQVELGELANEWRGFKFWSDNQSPKPMSMVVNKLQHPMLEEYVDCLHFILSIGLKLGYDNILVGNVREYETIEEAFNDVFTQVSVVRAMPNDYDTARNVHYSILIDMFINLGEMLGFQWGEVVQAYMSKNEVNHQRQESGY